MGLASMKNRFYLASVRDATGSSLSFHGKKGSGYSTDISLAMEYTREEMQKRIAHLRADIDLPISADHVDALTRVRVDCQYIGDNYPEQLDPNDEYVVYRQGCWDGNDLSFLSSTGEDYNYSEARVFSAADLNSYIGDTERWGILSKTHTDTITRKTFPMQSINRRKMIQGAGLVGVHKPREDRSSGKTRWNCPCCGKINWQYNPYDFDGCSDRSCDI
jgi:hypothetical protein